MASILWTGDAIGHVELHVRLSNQTIDSPLVSSPGILVAMNEPSLRKFDKSVRPGGWIIYNGETFPADCMRDDVRVLAAPFTHIADELGDPRACNMVMLARCLKSRSNCRRPALTRHCAFL